MRVTQRMMSDTVLNNLNNSMARLQTLQDQMSSGHTVGKPSDDPVTVSRVMALESAMAQHDQYGKNINDALGWLDSTDQALGNATRVLQRARELTVAGANDSLSQTDRNALAQEVEQLIGNLVQIGNTSYANRYIFGGTGTTKPPFTAVTDPTTGDVTAVTYNGNNASINYEVSQGVTLGVNVTGTGAFQVDASGNALVFQHLIALVNDLRSGNTANLSGTDLGNLDNDITKILDNRSTVGAKSNRLQMAKNNSDAESLNLTQLKAQLYDVDMAKIFTDYKMQETVYQAALATGAQMIQPTLVDFLK